MNPNLFYIVISVVAALFIGSIALANMLKDPKLYIAAILGAILGIVALIICSIMGRDILPLVLGTIMIAALIVVLTTIKNKQKQN